MKNWKSTLSFFVFVGIYVHSILENMDYKKVLDFVIIFFSNFSLFLLLKAVENKLNARLLC